MYNYIPLSLSLTLTLALMHSSFPAVVSLLTAEVPAGDFLRGVTVLCGSLGINGKHMAWGYCVAWWDRGPTPSFRQPSRWLTHQRKHLLHHSKTLLGHMFTSSKYIYIFIPNVCSHNLSPDQTYQIIP